MREWLLFNCPFIYFIKYQTKYSLLIRIYYLIISHELDVTGNPDLFICIRFRLILFTEFDFNPPIFKLILPLMSLQPHKYDKVVKRAICSLSSYGSPMWTII